MSVAAHTPGPWDFGKGRRWLFRDNLKHGGQFSSSTILKVDDDAFRPSEADARLIAAAPDGLAAAEGAYLALLRLPFNDPVRVSSQDVLAALRDFIANATGRDWGDVQADYENRAAISKATGEAA